MAERVGNQPDRDRGKADDVWDTMANLSRRGGAPKPSRGWPPSGALVGPINLASDVSVALAAHREVKAAAAAEEAKASEWRQELTEDGRVYYFNHVSGSSQWHVPNDLYVSARSRNGKWLPTVDGVGEGGIIMPSYAKPTHGVDVMASPPDRGGRPGAIAVEEQVDEAEVAAAASLPEIATLTADPRNMDAILACLPASLSSRLRSEAFATAVAEKFRAASAGIDFLQLESAAPLVAEILGEMDWRCSRWLETLGAHFDVEGAGVLSAAEFLHFVMFVTGISYIENAKAQA